MSPARPSRCSTPGQHVALRAVIDGQDLRRSYSLPATSPGELRVAVKRVDGRIFRATSTKRPPLGLVAVFGARTTTCVAVPSPSAAAVRVPYGVEDGEGAGLVSSQWWDTGRGQGQGNGCLSHAYLLCAPRAVGVPRSGGDA
jgi:hypothetical protein